jgi:hypothetical protein
MRVLIADDQEWIRRDLCAVLCEATEVEVCAEAVGWPRRTRQIVGI